MLSQPDKQKPANGDVTDPLAVEFVQRGYEVLGTRQEEGVGLQSIIVLRQTFVSLAGYRRQIQ
jgi:hypothetical protein